MIKLEDGSYTVYGLPHKYLHEAHPDIDWTERQAVVVDQVDFERLIVEGAELLGYRLTKIEC